MSGESPGYLRRLGLFDALMAVIGGIIGGGIFLNPAVVASRAETGPFILATWAIAGVVAVLGAFCFAELGSRRPEAGGGYVYLKETLGPLPAFLYGWTFLLVVNTGSVAAIAVVFGRYTTTLLGLEQNAVLPLAIGTMLFLSAVNYFGIRAGSITQNVTTVLKLAALAAIIIAGIFLTSKTQAPVPASATAGDASIIKTFAVALIPAIFAYGGWTHTSNIAGEIKNPEWTFPRAMILGILAVMAVYVLANVSYLKVLGAGGLAASEAPAADTMGALFGEAGKKWIALGVAISTFGFVNMAVLSAPRMLQAMAADGLFFKSAAVLHPKYRTPHVAIGIQAVWAVALTLSGTYGQLLDYITFGDWLFFGMIVSGIFIYRRRDERAGVKATHYQVPGYPFIPALFVLITPLVVASTIASSPRNALFGAIIVAIGIPVFLFWRKTAKITSPSTQPEP